MSKKQLWMLVGGNGSGKSTFYRTMLEPLGVPFINADIIARELYPESPELKSYEAATVAEQLRNKLLLQGESFCFETVFSHPSKIDFVGRAKALGYEVIMVYIHLTSPSLNKARVSQRVLEGGHFVPDDKVENRIPRTMEHVKTAIPLCDQVRILDNSSYELPFVQIATVIECKITQQTNPLPAFAKHLLKELHQG